MTRRAVPAVVLVPLLVVALVVSSSACGTLANFNGGGVPFGIASEPPPPPIVYGGVQWDIERALKSEAPLETKALIFPLWLLDLGVSATLDTATLPIVFWVNLRRAWGRAAGDPECQPPRRPASAGPRSPGWFPNPYNPTPAESVLNPPPADVDPD